MKNGDYYTHYKGGEYWFQCIALPLSEVQDKSQLQQTGTARYHENDKDIDLYFSNGVWFVDDDVPQVIYQSEKDYNTDKVWAREVDDFFGYKSLIGLQVKRFTLRIC